MTPLRVMLIAISAAPTGRVTVRPTHEAQSGIVLAEETGRPIAGARIVIQSRQVAARRCSGVYACRVVHAADRAG